MANFAAVAQSELILIKWPKLDAEAVAAEDRPCAPAVRVRAACYVLRATCCGNQKMKKFKCVRTFKMRVRKEVGRQQKP